MKDSYLGQFALMSGQHLAVRKEETNSSVVTNLYFLNICIFPSVVQMNSPYMNSPFTDSRGEELKGYFPTIFLDSPITVISRAYFSSDRM